jgi:hypothetical protein
MELKSNKKKKKERERWAKKKKFDQRPTVTPLSKYIVSP